MEKPVSKLNTWRISYIVGFNDVLADLDRYTLYFVLIRVIGCDFSADAGWSTLLYYVTGLLIFIRLLSSSIPLSLF
jgi:hypothetical protein